LHVRVFLQGKDDNQYKSQIITALDAIAVELNISIIIIHHVTDKDERTKGVKVEDLMKNEPQEVTIPYISKVLGTSAAISKTKVGMTMVHDSRSGSLYVWVQTNRDGQQNKFFKLQFDENTKRISNEVGTHEPEPHSEEKQAKQQQMDYVIPNGSAYGGGH
jgi:hypothetical protein